MINEQCFDSFDAPIANMLEHINLHPAYVTTSSCSGRIALFLEAAQGGESHKGKGGKWLLCVHGEVGADDVMGALESAQTTEGFVHFKTEPFILHVQCRCLEDATKLLEVAKAAGYRESGISPGCLHTSLTIYIIVFDFRSYFLNLHHRISPTGKSTPSWA
jgi:tRNA wybutosine-synthesizing protein 3